MALFGRSKNKKEGEEIKKTPQAIEETSDVKIQDIKGNWMGSGQQVLKEFYVSEKASILNTMNHYVFKVFNNANKAEIKKQVEKVFDVKVKDVKISNMPQKRRDLGRHPGFRAGFKKAIVVLKEGYSIEQAKA